MVQNPFQLDPEFVAQLWHRLRRILYTRASQTDTGTTLLPGVGHLTEIVQAAFWASLQKEENRSAGFSMVFLPPVPGPNTYLFGTPLALTPERLVKLAPALQMSKAQIGIWPDSKDELVIWGFTTAPTISKPASLPYWYVDTDLGWPLTIQVHQPGQLLVLAAHHAIALVTGRRGVFLEEQSRIWETALWSKIPLGVDPLAECEEQRLQIFQSFFKIAQAARAHNRGGLLLLVPDDEDWRHSVIQPMPYGGLTPYERARNCLVQYTAGYNSMLGQQGDLAEHILSPENIESHQVLNQSLEFIGQLTAVDGATVMTYGLRVLAFGVKIRPISAERRPEKLRLSELLEGTRTRTVSVSELGNTRHQSAAQFVFDQKGTIAFVISQDQRITVVAWDEHFGGVAALTHAELLFS